MTDLVWTPIKIRLGQIRPWQDNPRMSTKAQAQRLIKSERELGQIQTLAVSPFDGDYVDLYDGHQRCAAWNTVKEPSYEVTALQSNRKLTEDERRKVSVLLHMATGSWDWNALSSWSAADLGEWGMDNDALKGWNNDANNLKELLSAEVETADAEPQIDRAAELQEKWQTASGQLWQLGKHRLLIGDCTVRENVERLMGGERARLEVHDPPYAIGKDYAGEDLSGDEFIAFHNSWMKLACDFASDKETPFYIFVGCKTTFIFSDVIRKHLSIPRLLVWYRPDGHGAGGSDYFYNYDPIFYGSISGKIGKFEFADFARDVWIANKAKPEAGGFEHSTVKSLEVIEQPIKASSKDGDIVLDFFAGSGTTIIAAQNLSRRCYAMEISEKYGAVILERFASAFPDEKIELVSNGTPD